MATKSAEDISREYEDFFGPQDGPIVHRLLTSASQLFLAWRLFLYLFCGPTERVETLNKASGSTARVLQNLLWDNAILKIRALTDEERRGSNRNLSLGCLPRIAKRYEVDDLDNAFTELSETCHACRQYADKYLAHRDFHHSTGKKQVTLTRGETTKSVEAIGAFIRLFHKRVRNVDYCLAPFMGHDDAQQFLAYLHFGAIHQTEMNEALVSDLKAGRYDTRPKYEWPDWIRAEDLRETPFAMY